MRGNDQLIVELDGWYSRVRGERNKHGDDLIWASKSSHGESCGEAMTKTGSNEMKSGSDGEKRVGQLGETRWAPWKEVVN